ncbi:MAG: mannose-1-phosphate guanylyltransferase, partial [Deltaproteobacteria bacterium]
MVYPLIIAGGEGRRFWPLSTPKKPKQFLNLCHPKKSMLSLTFDRLASVFPAENIWMVTHESFWPLVRKQIPSLSRQRCLLEPSMKNTAAAIVWGAARILKQDKEATMVVLPADHWIKPDSFFRKDLKTAIRFVDQFPEALVTIGIKPTYAETGYGYLKLGAKKHVKGDLYRVLKFVEKPDLTKAKKMIQDGDCFWNSGIFVWKAKTILNEIENHLPKHFLALNKADDKEIPPIKKTYKKLSPVSIDQGVMEKASTVYALKASFEWSDLGSWESLSSYRKNSVKQWIPVDSKNCFIDTKNRRVATIGISDL